MPQDPPGSGAPVTIRVERLYGELFLMPLDDPWLGLGAPEVFDALPASRRGG